MVVAISLLSDNVVRTQVSVVITLRVMTLGRVDRRFAPSASQANVITGSVMTTLRCMPSREVHVHLTPHLVEPRRLEGADAVVIDVLRATTTIVHALAAGCVCVHPCAELDEARELAASMPKRKA